MHKKYFTHSQALFIKAMEVIRGASKYLVIILYLLMIIGVLLQVFVRYLPFSISGFAEISKFSQIWMILLASALAMRDRLHVGVDLLLDIMPSKLKSILYALIGSICVLFLWLTVYHSSSLIQIGLIQESPSLQIPMFIPYLAIPIGIGYLLIETAILYTSLAVKSWQGLSTAIRHDSEEIIKT